MADANKQRSIRGAQWSTAIDPQTANRATKEYLAALDDAAFGAASEVRPKFVSPSIRRRNGPAPCGARRFSAMRTTI